MVNCYRDLLLYSHAQIHCWCRSQAMLISVWIGFYICRASFVGVLYGAAALSTTNVAVPMIAHSIANLIAAVQWKLENKKEIETWQSSRAHWNASHCNFSCPCNTNVFYYNEQTASCIVMAMVSVFHRSHTCMEVYALILLSGILLQK